MWLPLSKGSGISPESGATERRGQGAQGHISYEIALGGGAALVGAGATGQCARPRVLTVSQGGRGNDTGVRSAAVVSSSAAMACRKCTEGSQLLGTQATLANMGTIE